MTDARLLVFVLALSSLSGCDAYIEKTKYDALQQKLVDEETDHKALQQKLVDEETDYKALQQKLVDSQETLRKAQEHKYQIFHHGLRTWRLDTVVGGSCIMLTTPEDWKESDTMRQSCACEDAQKDGANPSYETLRASRCLQ